MNCKFNKSISIFCVLHNQCNLRCKFCFETKEKGIRENSNINIDYIKKLPEDVASTVIPVMKNNDISYASIDIMGGELFSDNISDDIFDVYREFLYELKYKLYNAIANMNHQFTFFTNGIFTNHNRVYNLLKDTNSYIALSYDPIDRFTNDTQKEIWYNTFEYFYDRKEFHLMVSTVLTKKNIYAYINGDNIFDRIGNNVYIEAQEYSPRLDYEEYLPNDDDIYNFYKWCIDNNKFNVDIINDILNNIPHCNKGFTYSFSNGRKKYTNYCIESTSLSKEGFYGDYSLYVKGNTNYSDDVIYLGLQKRGCLLCEYYNKCPKMCYLQILFKEYKPTICPISRIYEYIDNNPNIIDKYNKWREEHDCIRR